MTLTKSKRLAREITDELLGPLQAEFVVTRAGGECRQVTREEAKAAIVKILLTPKPAAGLNNQL